MITLQCKVVCKKYQINYTDNVNSSEERTAWVEMIRKGFVLLDQSMGLKSDRILIDRVSGAFWERRQFK